jgi:PAS domain S-box-containing protein
MSFARRRTKILEALFTQSVDPIAITTQHGDVVRLNPAWHDVLGWTVEELTSKSLLHFVHFDDIPSMLRNRDQLQLPGTHSIHGELRFLHRFGEWRTLEFNATSDGNYEFTIYRDRKHQYVAEAQNGVREPVRRRAGCQTTQLAPARPTVGVLDGLG